MAGWSSTTPEIRQKLAKAIDSYTALYRKGCTPPDSVGWSNIDNNEQFLAQSVVMTPNPSLSIPNALKSERPDDYTRTLPRSNGRLARLASPFRSWAL
jgi:multiple sugar transport system substrate-binding protein